MADFTRETWANRGEPGAFGLNADRMNRLEAGILDAVQAWKIGTMAERNALDMAESQFWAFFVTDQNGGTLYVNFTGAAWTKVAPGLAEAGGGGGGGAIPWQEHVLAAVTTYTIPDLDGDVDEAYEIEVEGTITGGDFNLLVRPNDTDAEYARAFAYSGGAIGEVGATAMSLGRTGFGGTGHLYAHARLRAKTGRFRQMVGHTVVARAAAVESMYQGFGGTWRNTTDNLTSLVLGFQGTTFTGVARIRKAA